MDSSPTVSLKQQSPTVTETLCSSDAVSVKEPAGVATQKFVQETVSTGAPNTDGIRGKPKRKQRKYYRLRIPEDGYMWLKYGQKPIRGTNIMRNYYRCSMHRDIACPAKRTIDFNIDDLQELEIIHAEQHNHGLRDVAVRESATSQGNQWGNGHVDTGHWLDLRQPEMGVLTSILGRRPYGVCGNSVNFDHKDASEAHLEDIKAILEETRRNAASTTLGESRHEVLCDRLRPRNGTGFRKERFGLEKELRDLYRLWFTLTDATWNDSMSGPASAVVDGIGKKLISKTAGLPADVVAEALMEGRILAQMANFRLPDSGIRQPKRRCLSTMTSSNISQMLDDVPPALTDSMPLYESYHKPVNEVDLNSIQKGSWGAKLQPAHGDDELFSWLHSSQMLPSSDVVGHSVESEKIEQPRFFPNEYESFENSDSGIGFEGTATLPYTGNGVPQPSLPSLEDLATMALNVEAVVDSYRSPDLIDCQESDDIVNGCSSPPPGRSKVMLQSFPSGSSCSWGLDNSFLTPQPVLTASGDPLATLGGQDSLRIIDFIHFQDQLASRSANVY